MPRKKLIRTSEFPYHITSRSNNKEWFYIPIEDVWRYLNELIVTGRKKFGVEVKAAVLMSNHYHLCIYTPEENIDKFMQFLNKRLGEKISRQAGRINRIFGAPYKWSLITKPNYYLNVIRYIYQNPLRAGLCQKCEDYPYSDVLNNEMYDEYRDWWNTCLSIREENLTKKNLRKYII